MVSPVTAYAAPHDPTDVVGRRILAYGIDLVVMLGISVAVLVPMFMDASVVVPYGTVQCTESTDDGFSSIGTQGSRTEFLNDPLAAPRPTFCFHSGDETRYLPVDEENAFTARVYAVILGLQFANLVVVQALTGASVGKLLTGLRVVRQDGTKAGPGWIVLRWILLFVDSFCCFLPGAVLVFSTKGHRRLGDMAAGTYVVARSSMGTPVSTIPAAPGHQGGAWPPPSGVGTGWGTNAGEGTGNPWTPPGSAPPPSGPVSGPPVGMPRVTGQASSGHGPTWDPARNAYIQYDHDRGEWLEWDDDLKIWAPISR